MSVMRHSEDTNERLMLVEEKTRLSQPSSAGHVQRSKQWKGAVLKSTAFLIPSPQDLGTTSYPEFPCELP